MNHNLILYIGYAILGIAAIWWVVLWQKVRKGKTDNFNASRFELIPQLFPVIGILITFVGVAYGFQKFNVQNIEKSIPSLIEGLKSAFIASAIGVGLMIVSSFLQTRIHHKYKYHLASDETIELRQTNDLLKQLLNHALAKQTNDATKEIIQELQSIGALNQQILKSACDGRSFEAIQAEITTLNQQFSKYTVAQQHATSLLTEQFTEQASWFQTSQKSILDELQKQNGSEEALKNLLHKQIDVTESLKQVNEETNQKLDVLARKIAAPTAGLMEQVGAELKRSMELLVSDVRQVFSNNLKEEMTELAKSIRGILSVIEHFPEKAQTMTDSMAKAMEHANEKIESITKLLFEVQFYYNGAIEKEEHLSEKQITAMDKLNRILSGMTAFTKQLSDSWKQLESISSTFTTTNDTLRLSHEKVTESVLKMQQANEEAHITTRESIAQQKQILNTLKESVNTVHKLPEDFVEHFRVIDEGLEGIFSKINAGLVNYQEEVRSSINIYLDRFTNALSSANGAMDGNILALKELIEELGIVVKSYNQTTTLKR